MPVRAFPGIEQEQDGCREIAAAARIWRAHRLPEPPALGVGGEVEVGDEGMRHA